MAGTMKLPLRRRFQTLFLTGLLGVLAATCIHAGSNVRLNAEAGFLAVLSHKIQQSNNNTYFDYVRNGGQDILFNINRFSADWKLNGKHCLAFLYQPLAAEGTETLTDTLYVDNIVFPAGTSMRYFYGFPFYRVSWLYDTDPSPERELAFGLSMQIRNGTILFEALDGSARRSRRTTGPVPILKFRWRQPAGTRFWLGAEADGFYAPVSYINGSDNEVVGAICDASLRAGVSLANHRDAFLNIRYIGGGSVGTSEKDIRFGDGYLKNWLHFLTVTLGFGLGL